MDEFARKCIEDHKNPLVKFNLPGTKLLLKSVDEKDIEYTEEHLNVLEKVLRHSRVERRCARSQALWVKDLNLAKVTKVVKNLVNSFGFQDKSGIFLYPEEALFLLETNRLELKLDEKLMTIQDAYNVITNLPGYNVDKYLVYKKLALQGYRVINKALYDKKFLKKSSKQEESLECKRKIDEEPSDSNKKIKSNEVQQTSVKKQEVLINFIGEIFERLEKNAPKKYISDLNSENFEYYAFLPKNNSLNYDFKIFIRSETDFSSHCSSNEKDVTAVCSEGNIAFYKISKVVIPDLT